jgi:hypothetical protein
MTATIQVRADVGQVTSLLARVGDRLKPAIAKGCLRGAQHASGEIRKTLYATTEGRGGLARSFRERLVDEGGVFGAESYSELVYARIQEEGGTILPRTRKSLAVPLPFAKVAPGKWPRHFPQEGPQALHFIPRKGRAPLLAQVKKNAKGETVSVKPIFVLLKRVTVKPQRYIAATSARIAPEVETIVGDAIDEMLAGGGR